MKSNITFSALLFLALLAYPGGSILGQARSSNPPQQVQTTTVMMTDAQVEEQLKTIVSQLRKVQQLPPNDQVNLLREIERAIVKILESEQVRSARGAASAGQGAPGPRLVVRSTGLDSSLNLSVSGGAWWTDTELTSRLGITEEQRTRIDRAFTNHRMSLVTKRDILSKEESDLQRLLSADSLDPTAVGAQIYRVTTARAELERENATMALEMRQQMTLAQWNQLQALSPKATITVDVPVSPALGNTGNRTVVTPGPRGQ
jgi:hypothetical protein